ncbi:MAG: hypothetical protein ABSE73_05045 [Planctomycetota bacterium]
MPNVEKANPICPRCAKPIGVLAAYALPVAPAEWGAPPAQKGEPVQVYACPHCKTILGVGGGNESNIGKITIHA